MKKQVVIFAFCALCCGLFVLYSDPALEAARQGFYLWRDAVLPALLPFFICAHIMQNCGAISMQNPLFLYSVSMVSGAPTGARLAGSLEEDHTPAVAALNAVSPMFIAGSFAGSIIGVPQLAWPILIAQLVSAGVFFLLAKPAAGPALPRPNPPSFFRLLREAMAAGVAAMLSIGGAMLFFMAFMALLQETGLLSLLTAPLVQLLAKVSLPKQLPSLLLTGMLEMVAGCKALVEAGLSLRQTAALAAFFFSFGGICILVQSLAFARIRLGQYLGRKLLQGCLCALLAYFLCPLFLPDAQAVFAPASSGLAQNAFSALWVGGVSLLAASCLLLLSAWLGRIKDKLQRENCA